MTWPIRGSRRLFILLMMTALFAPFSLAFAEEVRVVVVEILASDRHANVDKDLKCIAEEVQKKEPTLTGFRQGRMTCKAVTVGAAEKFPLAEGQSATVTVQHGADKNNRVGLKVKPPLIGEITYTTCCGKYFPIVTRYQTKEGERLIVAIMVKPCKDKEK
jgi:hypothetical protein